jgi:hypothetical protein
MKKALVYTLSWAIILAAFAGWVSCVVEADNSASTDLKRPIKLEIDGKSSFFNEENKQSVYDTVAATLISNDFKVLPKDCPMNASIDKLSVLYEETKGREYSIPSDLTSFVVRGTKIKCTLKALSRNPVIF